MSAPVQHVVSWQFDEYEILQVIQCTGIQAVYAQEDEANPGKFRLEGGPIELLAVAKKTTTFLEKAKDAPIATRWRKCKDAEVENVIVGLELIDGSFEVCNEASNFAGYCRDGDDITKATAHLPTRDYPLST